MLIIKHIKITGTGKIDTGTYITVSHRLKYLQRNLLFLN